MTLRQPSNAYKNCALVTFWMLDTPAHPLPTPEYSFSLQAQLLLQFEVMFWGFSRQLSLVPNSAISTCTHKRWFADADVVLLYAWVCACRGLRNPLFRHFVYLPGWWINFHTLVLPVQVWIHTYFLHALPAYRLMTHRFYQLPAKVVISGSAGTILHYISDLQTWLFLSY